MEICITKHAIFRYRQRIFDYISTDQLIICKLREIASKGKEIHQKPCDEGNVYEVKYAGVSIVLRKKDDRLTIITCLGEETYRKWIKYQCLHGYVGGRIRYPLKDFAML